MNLVSVRRNDPFSSLVDDVFNDFFHRAALAPAGNEAAVARARMDVIDRGAQFEIKVDLPGVAKEDIDVAVEGARVTLQAETRKQTEAKDGERVLLTERSVTRYGRTFELPAEVTEDGAEARFENGVLTLLLPKRVAATARKLAIQ
jgi:HSP20 family protein